MKQHQSEKREIASMPSTWKRQLDFLMSLLGMSIGLGNVWRFPYLCYKNGGGAFLVAYIILLAVFVVPVIIMELAMGQFTRCSAITVWKVVPVLRGIGYAAYVIVIFSNSYYPVLMAWSVRWLISALSLSSPWTKCSNSWNSENCISIFNKPDLNETTLNSTFRRLNSASQLSNVSDSSSSVEEYWRKYILAMSGGLEEYGTIKWDLALCLLAVWLLTYFAVFKGIAWTSKIVYVTATLPIAIIFVVLIRGVTLSGASTGIVQYLTPNLTKLGEFELWTDAANQVTFSFIIGYGCLISIASHNKYHYNLIRDALIVSCSNAAVSFTSGFAIFSVLGHLAEIKNTTVDAVAESGPGMAFMVYPTALSLLPLPNMWIAIFFITLILLGLDTMYVMQDGLYECTKDIAPRLFRGKYAHEIGHGIISGLMFVMGLSMVTNGGIYVFHIMNTYPCAGWCVYVLVLFELIGFSWIYGTDKICANMHDMMKIRIPTLWLTVSLKYISPIVSMLLVIYSLWTIKPLTYDRTYSYAIWANVVAWMSAFSSVIFIPITAVYVIWKTPGDNLVEKIRNSTKSKMLPFENSEETKISEKESILAETTATAKL